VAERPTEAENPTEAETPMILSRPEEGETRQEFSARLTALIRGQIAEDDGPSEWARGDLNGEPSDSDQCD
jgi:hypothetical protein